ncbi:MAG TPA: cyclic nucleotide-binding domain-containing protein [Opitutaceae bacterium]
MDTNLLLTGETLRLAPGLVRGQPVKGAFTLKDVASQVYLTVDAKQMRVLEEFEQPHTVPEVLENCIRNRACLALREYYDLVLKASRAGVLRVEGAEPLPRHAIPWLLPLRPRWVLPLHVLAVAGMIALVVLRPPSLPGGWLDVLWGWLVACAALSCGQALAASMLRGSGCEIYRPHLRWRTGLPHFAIDASDVRMLGRLGRAAVFASPLLPLALATSAGLWWSLRWSVFPLAVLLLQCWPVGRSAGGRLLDLCRRRPLLDTDLAPLFDAPLSLGEQWRNTWRVLDVRVALLQLAAGVVWVAATGAVVFRLLGLDPALVRQDWAYWQAFVLILDAVLVVTFLGWLGLALEYHLIDGCQLAWRRWSVGARRWRTGRDPLGENADYEALIRRNPLLRRLDPETQTELARHLRPFRSRPWRTLIRFDEEPPFVGLILSGSATLYRRAKSGRRVRFLQVIEGDLFGAHKLVDPDNASLQARADTPLYALVLNSSDFNRLVVGKLGAASVRNYVHKHLFLQRCSLCAEWRPAAIARFAELAEIAAHAKGRIMQRGQEVRSLYVLYEGRARALEGAKQVGKLRPGDVFGEISLLQASVATTDVEASDDSRCLVIDRVEFIRFMSRNHHVALQMERLCSKRLGRPVFPLDARS